MIKVTKKLAKHIKVLERRCDDLEDCNASMPLDIRYLMEKVEYYDGYNNRFIKQMNELTELTTLKQVWVPPPNNGNTQSKRTRNS